MPPSPDTSTVLVCCLVVAAAQLAIIAFMAALMRRALGRMERVTQAIGDMRLPTSDSLDALTAAIRNLAYGQRSRSGG